MIEPYATYAHRKVQKSSLATNWHFKIWSYIRNIFIFLVEWLRSLEFVRLDLLIWIHLKIRCLHEQCSDIDVLKIVSISIISLSHFANLQLFPLNSFIKKNWYSLFMLTANSATVIDLNISIFSVMFYFIRIRSHSETDLTLKSLSGWISFS